MNKLLNHSFFNEYTPTEWKVLKVCVSLIWFKIVATTFINTNNIAYPCGICSLVDCSFLLTAYTRYVFVAAAAILTGLYIAEKRMSITTLLMFILSLLLFTLEESNGVLNRNSLYTMVFLAQTIAYYRNNADLPKERIEFAVQIIAAGYILAGISKLNESGLNWISQAPQASVQMVKGYAYEFFNDGELNTLQQGTAIANGVLKHAFAVKLLFAFSLFLELFAWVAVKNKTRTFVYGLLLTGMHIGIYYFMQILIESIFYPMLLFMVNPVYLVWLLLTTLKQKLFG